MQITLFFSRTGEQTLGGVPLFQIDVIMLIIFLIIWVGALILIKKGRLSQNRNLFLFAVILGALSLGLQLYWRGILVS